MRHFHATGRRVTALIAGAITLGACQSDRPTSALADDATDVNSALVINDPSSGAHVSLSVGDSARLEATQNARRGRLIRWSTSNESIASVNQQGMAVATGLGSTVITAAGMLGVERWTLDVSKAVASVVVSPDSLALAPAGTSQLTVVVKASDGTVLTGRKTTFTVANATVASVSAAGLVTAKIVGSTTVTVNVGGISSVVKIISAVVVTPPTIPTDPTPPTNPTPPTPPTTPSGELGLNASLIARTLFPASNPWNQPVDTAQVDPNSAAIIANIGPTKLFHPDFGANYDGGPFGIPYYVVSGAQARVNVTFDYDDESDHGTYPIPANAPIEGGAASDGDRHVIIVDRDNWKLYELYAAYPQANGSWHAGSGAIFDLTSNALRPAGWTSADAAGLAVLPGLVRYDEVSAGNIAHAIRFTVARSRKAYIAPARHWASSDTSSLRPPMGMRVRLKASVNISSYPASAQTILRALKKYGMIVADNGSDWYASGTADARWNDNEINSLKALKGSDFEVVRMTGIVKP